MEWTVSSGWTKTLQNVIRKGLSLRPLFGGKRGKMGGKRTSDARKENRD